MAAPATSRGPQRIDRRCWEGHVLYPHGLLCLEPGTVGVATTLLKTMFEDTTLALLGSGAGRSSVGASPWKIDVGEDGATALCRGTVGMLVASSSWPAMAPSTARRAWSPTLVGEGTSVGMGSSVGEGW